MLKGKRNSAKVLEDSFCDLAIGPDGLAFVPKVGKAHRANAVGKAKLNHPLGQGLFAWKFLHVSARSTRIEGSEANPEAASAWTEEFPNVDDAPHVNNMLV